MQPSIAYAVIGGVAVILAVSVYVFGRLRIEQERTIQKLVDRGLSGEDLLKTAGVVTQADLDLRRGALLIAVGLSWSVATFLIGGTAWLFGLVPIALGIVFLLFRILDGRSR
ncbi:MAG: hypothetical protein AB1635_15910 [Acidobacteriota bacterium]